MSAQMSCSRKTRRWPLCVFYGMLNTTIFNSWIVYKEKSSNDCKRRKFALALANELGKEWIRKRLQNPSLPTIVKEEIKLYGGATSLWGSTRSLFVLLYDEIKIMKTH